MVKHDVSRPWGLVSAGLLGVSLLALSGCGANGFAKDALVEDAGAEAFLDRIEKNCGKLSIGDQPLNYLLSTANNDTTFVDLTSKFYLGQNSWEDYASTLNAFYNTGTNKPALDCIRQQR